MAQKKTYFVTDAHLGARVFDNRNTHEQKFVRWLDMAKQDADAIYMLGDMFDFWFEYRATVPKGFSRTLGKMAELADAGIDIHYFTGNHDVWTFGYLENEIGLKVHRCPTTFDIHGKRFFLAHGDGLNDKSRGFSLIRAIFHSKTCQWLFRTLIPPVVGLNFGYKWSESNRRKHLNNHECNYKGENNEPLVLFAKQHKNTAPDIDYYLFGHRHILLHLLLDSSTQLAILGDFMQQFSYATFDGENFEIHYFEAE